MKHNRALTTREVADYCSVSFHTVIRWIERGDLIGYKLPGRGDYRITIDNFVNFLSKNKIPLPEEFKSTQKTVLIVDDDPSVTASLSRQLKKEGYDIFIAHDGFEAGVMLSSVKPAIMLLDIKMPKMSGMDVLKCIQGQNSVTPKIIVISSLTKGEKEKIFELGAHDYIEKPFKKEALLEKMNKLLT